MKKTLSIIVPAYNEEENLKEAILSVEKIASKYCSDYEIIIINDGSKDTTGEIAATLSKKNKKIKVLTNNPNRGMGYTYWRGVKNAKYEYTILVWGDNAHTDSSLHKILSNLGKVDVVIPNYTNIETRTWFRRTVSKLFTKIVNLITDLPIKYYNGTTLYKTDLLKKMPRKSTGFGYQAEVLAYILKKGASYIQVDVLRQNKPDGKTSAFKLKNIVNVAKSLYWLLWQCRLKSYLS